jgi:hypothetical protein
MPRETDFFPLKRYTCGNCTMRYVNYKELLTHLFWKHGTESVRCQKCYLKRWLYAPHACNVLPIEDLMFKDEIGTGQENDTNNNVPKRESVYCYCGKNLPDEPMIGCDGSKCVLQWYHFSCVAISEPPDGNWLCPTCSN